MTRHGLREKIFRALFMEEFHDKDEFSDLMDNYLTVAGLSDGEVPEGSDEEEAEAEARFLDEKIRPLSEKDQSTIKEKVADIRVHQEELDASIAGVASGWSIDRMNKVDLVLLRLALYEMRIEGLDAGIAINEAVELAKSYGEERSGAFVNGILGKLA